MTDPEHIAAEARTTLERLARVAEGRGTEADHAAMEAMVADTPIGDDDDCELWERIGRTLRERDASTYRMLRGLGVTFAALLDAPVEN